MKNLSDRPASRGARAGISQVKRREGGACKCLGCVSMARRWLTTVRTPRREMEGLTLEKIHEYSFTLPRNTAFTLNIVSHYQTFQLLGDMINQNKRGQISTYESLLGESLQYGSWLPPSKSSGKEQRRSRSTAASEVVRTTSAIFYW